MTEKTKKSAHACSTSTFNFLFFKLDLLYSRGYCTRAFLNPYSGIDDKPYLSNHSKQYIIYCHLSSYIRTKKHVADLEVLCLGLHEVHEVVQLGGSCLGGIGAVCLLDRHQQGGGQQAVPEHKFPRGDVHLQTTINFNPEALSSSPTT